MQTIIMFAFILNGHLVWNRVHISQSEALEASLAHSCWSLSQFLEICPGLTLIRCTRIAISVTKCPLALLPNFNITRFSEYRQLMSQSVPLLLK